jgi:hypothetical protein
VLRCEVRTPAEIAWILQAAYGPQPDAVVLRLSLGLRRAAAWIEAGDLGRAGIEIVKLGCPDLEPEAMAKLAEIGDLEKRSMAWETEPRIPAGQAGGGQWTTGGGSAPTAEIRPAGIAVAQSARAESPAPRSLPWDANSVATDASGISDADSPVQYDSGLLVHVSTAAVVGARAAEDMAPPGGIARLGRAGLLMAGAALLDNLDAGSGRDQIAKAIARFGLDPSRPNDVMAASAYVWSRYALPWVTKARFNSPELDAASQAVLRFVLVNPGAFIAMRQGSKGSKLIVEAANAGLADYT